MENRNEHISRLVRIKFKCSSEVVEGNIIFNTQPSQDPVLPKLLTMIRFRFNDAQRTEAMFNLMDVDTIDYL